MGWPALYTGRLAALAGSWLSATNDTGTKTNTTTAMVRFQAPLWQMLRCRAYTDSLCKGVPLRVHVSMCVCVCVCVSLTAGLLMIDPRAVAQAASQHPSTRAMSCTRHDSHRADIRELQLRK